MSVYIRDTKHEHGKAGANLLESSSDSDDWETDPTYVNNLTEEEARWGSKETGTSRGADGLRSMHEIRTQAKSQDVLAAQKAYEERGKFSRGYGGANGVEEPREAGGAGGGEQGGEQGAVSQCRALYDYEAQDDTELGFAEGDVITVHQKIDDGWWSGELNGSVGVFPANFVEDI